jgi:hypothetical protein
MVLPIKDTEGVTKEQKLEQEFEIYKAKQVCEITQTMKDEEIEDLKKEFVKRIKDNTVLMKKFEMDGFDNLTIRLLYEAFLEEMLLKSAEIDFKKFKSAYEF